VLRKTRNCETADCRAAHASEARAASGVGGAPCGGSQEATSTSSTRTSRDGGSSAGRMRRSAIHAGASSPAATGQARPRAKATLDDCEDHPSGNSAGPLRLPFRELAGNEGPSLVNAAAHWVGASDVLAHTLTNSRRRVVPNGRSTCSPAVVASHDGHRRAAQL
jgi:hypothetical protein